MFDRFKIQKAARLIKLGGVIAYPTEGVYGLGCLPGAPDAVARILAIKGRRETAGLILIAANSEQLAPWITPTAIEYERLNKPTKQPTTWIVTAHADTPAYLTGGRTTLAVRITRHELSANLCLAADSALVSTSANRSGQPPGLSAQAVRRRLGKELDGVLSGALGGAMGPSEIRVAKDNRVLRPAS